MRRTATLVPCVECGTQVERQPNQLARAKQVFCSRQCYGRNLKKALTGPLSPTWKGGRVAHGDGYVRIKVGRDHPMGDAAGYALEHRIVMSQRLGRMLLPTEVVHHVNHVRSDNRDENLYLYESNSAHRVGHSADLPPRLCWCGAKHDAKGLCHVHYKQQRRREHGRERWNRKPAADVTA